MNKAALLWSSLLGLATTAEALVNLGEGRIDLEVQGSVFYDSEIRARDLGQDDFVFSLRPSLVYTRPSRKLDLSATLSARAVAYLDNDQYNNTDVFLDLNASPNASVQTDRFRLSGDLNLSSESRADAAIGDIVTIRNYRAAGQLIYDMNRRITLVGTAGVNQRDPDEALYTSVTSYTASASVQTPLNQQLILFGTWSAEKVDSERNSTDSKIFTYSGGLSGTLFSKVTGSASAGIQARHFKNREDETTPYFSASLEWAVDDTSSINLRASQTVGTTIDDRSTETLLVVLGARREFNNEFSGRVFAEYEDISFNSSNISGRQDEVYSLGGSITYDWVRQSQITLQVRYSDRTSSDFLFQYDRLRVGLLVTRTW